MIQYDIPNFTTLSRITELPYFLSILSNERKMFSDRKQGPMFLTASSHTLLATPFFPGVHLPLFLSLIPSFSKSALLFMRLMASHVFKRGTQIFPLHLSLIPNTVFLTFQHTSEVLHLSYSVPSFTHLLPISCVINTSILCHHVALFTSVQLKMSTN